MGEALIELSALALVDLPGIPASREVLNTGLNVFSHSSGEGSQCSTGHWELEPRPRVEGELRARTRRFQELVFARASARSNVLVVMCGPLSLHERGEQVRHVRRCSPPALGQSWPDRRADRSRAASGACECVNSQGPRGCLSARSRAAARDRRRWPWRGVCSSVDSLFERTRTMARNKGLS